MHPADLRARPLPPRSSSIHLLGIPLICLVYAACAMARRPAPEALRLTPSLDSFALRVGGRTVGKEIQSLDRTAAGWRFRDVASISGVTQETEVDATPEGVVQRMHQRLQRGSTVAVSDLRYARGRITGTVQVPAPAGVKTLAIDTTAVPGVVDDNFVAALEPSLPWGSSALIRLPVFVGGENATQQWTFRVVDTAHVTVPAGTFRSLLVELTAGQRTVRTHIEADPPHRVLSRAPAGSPLEFVRLP